MAKNDSTQRTIINGFEPVTVMDIECTAHIAVEQADAMEALFRIIARLTDDREVMALCNHGALQAAMQSNCIDALRERAMEAGLASRSWLVAA